MGGAYAVYFFDRTLALRQTHIYLSVNFSLSLSGAYHFGIYVPPTIS